QANVQTQWSFNADVSYRSRQWLSSLSADSALTIREDADRQLRNTLTLQSQRFLHARWAGLAIAQFQQNEELALDLRAVLGAGVKRVLVQSNRSELAAAGAVAYTLEQYSGAEAAAAPEARALLLRLEPGSRSAGTEHPFQKRHRRRPLLERQRVRKLQRRSSRWTKEQRFRSVCRDRVVVLIRRRRNWSGPGAAAHRVTHSSWSSE